MNQKGFSLIELIITIGIMVMIGLVIVSNMTGLFSKNEDKDYENFVKKIEDAACIYIEKNEQKENKSKCRTNSDLAVCNIDMNTLIQSGLIEESLKDPNKGIFVKNSSYKVHIHWIDNEKKCELKTGD